jgi:hypothetical protein
MVVVTNSYGSVTSQVATLTVPFPPSVSIQPASQTNLAGTTVSFNIAATGIGPFTYQWQFNGTNFPNNLITTVAGNGTNGYSGDGGAATNASFYNPWGMAFDTVGNLYISDRYNNVIREVATNGIITTVAGNGIATYAGDGGPATNASLNSPIGVTFDAAGNLYIADRYNDRIRKVSTNGIISTVSTNASLGLAFGVACDAFGDLYFTGDLSGFPLLKVDTNGIVTAIVVNGLSSPGDIAFDASGNLYIADTGNNIIRKMATNGIISIVAGNGSATYAGDGGAATNASLNGAQFVAFDATGNLYISDRYNNVIREMNTNGLITTVAGNGTIGNSGNGGAATNASLHSSGVAFDASGNLYIADDVDNVIREVYFAGNPTFTLNNIGATNAGNYTVVITSPYGSVTSVVATLTVIIPPQIVASGANFGFITNLANQSGFGFNVSGVAGQTIVVDGSTNMVNWTPLYTNTAGSTPFYFFDPAATNFPGRFYRATLSQ